MFRKHLLRMNEYTKNKMIMTIKIRDPNYARRLVISVINQFINIFCSKLVILCLIAIVSAIGLALIPEVFIHVKAENNANSENLSMLVKKGVALNNLGNYTGAIKYIDKALAILLFK